MKHYHASLITLCIIVMAIIGTYGFQYLSGPPLTQPYRAYDSQAITPVPVDAFDMETIADERVNIKDLKGKVVLLHFWATWCPPCVVEFPHLKELSDAKPNDIVVVAISADRNADVIDTFLNKTFPDGVGDNFLVVHDPMQKIIQERFQTYRLPETIIINSQGEMVEKIIGGNTLWGDKEIIEHLMTFKGK